jgi:hypothetical protein
MGGEWEENGRRKRISRDLWGFLKINIFIMEVKSYFL